jgi:hypothetical protein
VEVVERQVDGEAVYQQYEKGDWVLGDTLRIDIEPVLPPLQATLVILAETILGLAGTKKVKPS